MKPLDDDTRSLFVDTLRRLLPPAETSGAEAARTDLWRDLAESGIIGLGLPEWAGGFDAGMTDHGLVMRALGGSLASTPYLSGAVMAGWLLAELEGERAAPDLSRMAGGNYRLGFAHYEPESGFDAHRLTARLAGSTGGLVVTGTKVRVLDAVGADAVLLSVRDAQGALRICLVERGADGLNVESRAAVDGSDISTLVLRDTPARLLGEGDAARLVHTALDRGAVAACAEALGVMEEVARHTREYLKTRRAFGKTLSQFQVLQHRYVDMLIALEETRAVVAAAEAACDTAAEDTSLAIAACKVVTSRAARFIGSQGIQLHGGVGVTDSLVITHFYKRLMVLDAAFGHGEYHLRAHARRLQAAHRPTPASSVPARRRA